jgi:HSP20 family protein
MSNNLLSNPFAVMRRLMEDMEQRMFEGFGASLSRDPLQGIEQTAWSPDLEVVKHGDHLIVRADLPGLHPNDLKVRLEDGVLSIEGERRAEHTSESAGIWHSERRYGRFVRKVNIQPEVHESEDLPEPARPRNVKLLANWWRH